MSDLPQGIDLPRHRDFEGKAAGQWLRHGFLLLLTIFIVAALLNVFGAGPQTEEASGGAASLKITAPERVRGGLLYQARLEIHANEAIGAPTLVFDKGWIEETTGDGPDGRARPGPLRATPGAGGRRPRSP